MKLWTARIALTTLFYSAFPAWLVLYLFDDTRWDQSWWVVAHAFAFAAAWAAILILLCCTFGWYIAGEIFD